MRGCRPLRPEEVVAVTQSFGGRYQWRDRARVRSHFSDQAASKAGCEVAIRFNMFHRPAL